MHKKATLQHSLSIPDYVLMKELMGEGVLLNLDSGTYFGLDRVATHMWNVIEQHSQLQAAYLALLQRYDVSEDQLRTDLLNFADTMVANGLLVLEEETYPSHSPTKND